MSDAFENLMKALMGGRDVRTIGANGGVSLGYGGQDHMMPVLELKDDTGKSFTFMFTSPQAIAALGTALGHLAAGTAARLCAVQHAMHGDEDIGCEKTHKIMGESMNAITGIFGPPDHGSADTGKSEATDSDISRKEMH